MLKTIKIENKIVGTGHPAFIIAEAGVNHNGDIVLAKRLVDVAKQAGADAVKFQTFKAEGVAVDNVIMAAYQEKNVGRKEAQTDLLRSLELDYDSFRLIKEYCDAQDILFLSTPHSEDAIDFLEPLVPAYKMGSGDLVNTPFLRKIAQKGKPVFLGTGMATLDEVRQSLEILHSAGNRQVVMLHCTTNYPCPLDEVNLLALDTMAEVLDCLVGYSDHTIGIHVPILAILKGAVVIEKHFTLDRNLPGPDHRASLEPAELEQMVGLIRQVPILLGSSEKKPTPAEMEIAKIVRKSLVAAQNIQKGQIIRAEMVAVKRPAIGLSPLEIDKVVDRTATRDIVKDEFFSFDSIE